MKILKKILSPLFKFLFWNPYFPNRTNLAAPYASALATVDVAPIRYETGEVLLGRKKKEKLFRFIGGFVDVKDASILAAAKREKREESGDFECADYKVIGNPQIKDPRYANDKDCIFTTFYICRYLFGAPKAGDDIAEVRWFNIDKLSKNDVMPVHHELLETFLLNQGRSIEL